MAYRHPRKIMLAAILLLSGISRAAKLTRIRSKEILALPKAKNTGEKADGGVQSD